MNITKNLFDIINELEKQIKIEYNTDAEENKYFIKIPVMGKMYKFSYKISTSIENHQAINIKKETKRKIVKEIINTIIEQIYYELDKIEQVVKNISEFNNDDKEKNYEY